MKSRHNSLSVRLEKAVVVTEESAAHWRDRQKTLALAEQVGFVCRPFRCRPSSEQWQQLLDHLLALHGAHPLDLVVFDPRKTWTISKRTSHCLSDHNLYEGTKVKGTPTATLVRGTVVVQNNKLVAKPGHGRFVRRAAFGEELLPVGRNQA